MKAITEPKISINQFFVILGFIMGIISLFTLWISIDFNHLMLGMSGWYLTASDNVSKLGLDEIQRYFPLIIFIISFIGAFLITVNILMPNNLTKKLEIFIPLLGLIMLILAIMFGVWDTKYFGEVFDSAGVGLWISIIGSLLIMIFGTIDVMISLIRKEKNAI